MIKRPHQRKNVISTKMLKASSGVGCRICKSCSGNDLMKSPCYCKGSMGYVHFKCLEQWLNQASRDYCELCRYKFHAIQTRRYSLIRSLMVWTLHPSNRTYLIYDILIAVVLTALTACIVFICLVCNAHVSSLLTRMGAEVFETGSNAGAKDPFVRTVISLFLFILLSSYATTLYLIVQDHVRPWYRWWKNCVDVKLLIDPNKVEFHRNIPTHKVSTDNTTPLMDIESRELLSFTQSGSTLVKKEIDLEKTKSEVKIGKTISKIFTIS